MLKKPTAKTVTSVALAGGAIVLGAKIGDGVSAVMPASTNSYKRWILGVGGIVAAACINPSTTAAQAVQNGLLGLGAKQLYDEATDALKEAIPVKVQVVDTTGAKVELNATDRFVQAIVGHLGSPAYEQYLGAPWEGENSDATWERPIELEPAAPLLSFTGV
ncbi:hypothetical protein ACM55F_10025 [Flavobacterium sp. XS2P12]|uniref:hypothetical protein n=1 Tax=Flavobacterium melibiosi TaxID=3398734 RepID=UPI003A86BE37